MQLMFGFLSRSPKIVSCAKSAGFMSKREEEQFFLLLLGRCRSTHKSTLPNLFIIQMKKNHIDISAAIHKKQQYWL